MTLGVSSSDTGGIDDIIQIQGGASAMTSQTAIAGVTTGKHINCRWSHCYWCTLCNWSHKYYLNS